jgi:hypothetical protein
MLRRSLAGVIAGLLCFALAGCTVPIPDNLDSGIVGTVLAGPTCPVVRPDYDCNDRPLSATIIVRSAATKIEVTRFSSDANGNFRVPLYPGTYELDPQPGSPGGLPASSPQTVEVKQGVFTEVAISYDTGIR